MTATVLDRLVRLPSTQKLLEEAEREEQANLLSTRQAAVATIEQLESDFSKNLKPLEVDAALDYEVCERLAQQLKLARETYHASAGRLESFKQNHEW